MSSGRSFSQLLRDRSGNTLAIVGAALLPLTAMIGSGVDMSRAYMAKTRLQSACDAAALAGRRIMSGDTFNDQVRDEAIRFFNFNFAQNLYQTASFTPNVSRPSVGTVRVTASTTIPTTVMSLFGFTNIPISAECDATLNYVNTDVMLVMDTTGSMADDPSGANVNSGPTSKIVALRDAVLALYDALAPIQGQLEAAGLRLRYGVVPYSQTVNVGHLIRDVNPAYLANSVEYQTRVANMNTPTYTGTPGTPESPVTQVYGSSISQANCDLYGRNLAFSGFTPSATTGGGPPPAATWSRTFSNNEAAGVDWGWSGASDTSGSSRSCRRRYVETDTTYVTEYTFTNWSYEAEAMDVSTYKTGSPVAVANYGASESPTGKVPVAGVYDLAELERDGVGIPSSNITWNGCIEERQTNNAITSSSGFTIPADALDLNINLVPSSEASKWRPMWPFISYRRAVNTTASSSGTYIGSAACPAPARRLSVWNRGQMESYVQSLVATGSTYHDIGMIWGARMISSAGIFADSPDSFNSMPVARHIIFMTDGEMAPSETTYAFHGVERNDRRVSGTTAPSNSDLTNRHTQRFRMICNAAKSNNTSIWVIAFGTALTPELIECASNPNQATTAANRTQLIQRFTEIGQNIGALRLIQ